MKNNLEKNLFSELGLKTEILKAVLEQNFEKPTDIQGQTIPFLLNYDGDFVGQAQTGTGKTVAYLLPLLQKLDSSKRHIQALIMTPTRELANQVNLEIEKFSKYLRINSVAVFGGASVENQIKAIKSKKPQVIVGTPGRLKDFINRRVLKFENAQYIILDEADEMLNMGFLEDVQNILSSFKEHKYLWMFSATMPAPILSLIKKQFNNPKMIKAKNKSISNDNIEQGYYLVKEKYHTEALSRILDMEPDMYGLVFCRTKIQTKKLSETLLSQGYLVESLHGDMSQAQRDYAMANFKKQKSKLMICTDVAARGIDVNNLTHVINFGFPQDLESYVHRIGRTGRADKKGKAITILDPKDLIRLRHLERFIKKDIKRLTLPNIETLKEAIIRRDIESLNIIKNRTLEKGKDFRVDKSFDIFFDNLKDLDKETLLKVIFSWAFDAKLRSYNKLDNLDIKGESLSIKKNKAKRGYKKSGDVKIFMNVGKVDGIKIKEFLEDFSKHFGMKKYEINNVDFKGTFSFLEIPAKYAKNLVEYKGFKYKDRQVRFEYANA